MQYTMWLHASLFLLGVVSATIFDDIKHNLQKFPFFRNAETNDDINTPSVVTGYGYPVESHNVTTDDGYVLTVHRIPTSPSSGNATDRPVLLIQPPLFCSSTDWVIQGPNNSIAFLAADEGYDVWLGNYRGNGYCRKHVTLSPDDPEFWDFSFDEIGYYDLPAIIDYILGKTEKKDIYYTGHSLGTTSLFAMACSRTEYNKKIKVMVALAPATFFSHMKSAIRYLAPISRQLDRVLSLRRTGEMPVDLVEATFLSTDLTRVNTSLIPLVGRPPSSTSARLMLHYTQLIKSGKFEPYDCDSAMSYRKCFKRPPVSSYNVSDITMTVSLIYAEKDNMADPKDVTELHSKLSNVNEYYKIPRKNFNHCDYLVSVDAAELVYKKVFEILKKDRSET